MSKAFATSRQGTATAAVLVSLNLLAAVASSGSLAAQDVRPPIISRLPSAPGLEVKQLSMGGWPAVQYSVDDDAYVVVFAVSQPGPRSSIRVVEPESPRDLRPLRAKHVRRIERIGDERLSPYARFASSMSDRDVLVIAFASYTRPVLTSFAIGNRWDYSQAFEITSTDPTEVGEALASALFDRNIAYDMRVLTLRPPAYGYAELRYASFGLGYGGRYGGCDLRDAWLRSGYVNSWRSARFSDPVWNRYYVDRTPFAYGFAGGYPFWLIAQGYAMYDPRDWQSCFGFRSLSWAFRDPDIDRRRPTAPTARVAMPRELDLPRHPTPENAPRMDTTRTRGQSDDRTFNRPRDDGPRREPPVVGTVTIEPPRAELPPRVIPRGRDETRPGSPRFEPPRSEPQRLEPPRAETPPPPRIAVPRNDPDRPEPPHRIRPPQAESPRAEPPRAEPPRAEPPRAEPPRAEPPRVVPPPESRRAEPARVEPARAEPPRTPPPVERPRVPPPDVIKPA